MSHRLPIALIALVITISVGCKEPAGFPSNRVHAATTRVQTCYVSNTPQSGHVDWYQGYGGLLYDHYGLSWYTITRAHYLAPVSPPRIAWPHKNGFCVFTVPHFVAAGGVVACTLYYYQADHSGSASLLVNSWVDTLESWPPTQYDTTALNILYWEIWNSNDTVATDITHATDGCWYKVAVSPAAAAAIADTAAAYQDYGFFRTGWVYRDSVDGTYTDVSGYDGNGYEPYIKIWYDE